MRVFASVLLAGCSTFAYQVTYPGDNNGWTTSGPNVLEWQRIDSDPLNFSLFLTNVNNGNSQLLDDFIDGTRGSYVCETPSGGWPSGSGFRANIATDAQHPNSLLAQSDQFKITVASNGTTNSGSTQTTAAGVGLFGAVAALTALINTLL